MTASEQGRGGQLLSPYGQKTLGKSIILETVIVTRSEAGIKKLNVKCRKPVGGRPREHQKELILAAGKVGGSEKLHYINSDAGPGRRDVGFTNLFRHDVKKKMAKERTRVNRNGKLDSSTIKDQRCPKTLI